MQTRQHEALQDGHVRCGFSAAPPKLEAGAVDAVSTAMQPARGQHTGRSQSGSVGGEVWAPSGNGVRRVFGRGHVFGAEAQPSDARARRSKRGSQRNAHLGRPLVWGVPLLRPERVAAAERRGQFGCDAAALVRRQRVLHAVQRPAERGQHALRRGVVGAGGKKLRHCTDALRLLRSALAVPLQVRRGGRAAEHAHRRHHGGDSQLFLGEQLRKRGVAFGALRRRRLLRTRALIATRRLHAGDRAREATRADGRF